jgi:hypothetical protein
MLTYFCFPPQIDSECKPGPVRCLYHLTDVILTLSSCPCTLDLILIYFPVFPHRSDDHY